jgi:hypothetical protein
MGNPIVPTRPFRLFLRPRDADGEPIDLGTHSIVFTLETPDSERRVIVHEPPAGGTGPALLEFDLEQVGWHRVSGLITYPDGGTSPTREYSFYAIGPSRALEADV